MNLKTLKYYIAQEKYEVQRIFICAEDWNKLLEQIGPTKIYVNNWFDLDNISIHKNLFLKLNYAKFVVLNGDLKLDESYSYYEIEILTPEEKVIRDIIE